MRPLSLPTFLFLATAAQASAQPPIDRARAASPAPPLTAEQAQKIERRLRAYTASVSAAGLRVESLRARGLSRENDAVEALRSAGTGGPAHVGLLEVRPPAGRAADPGLVDAQRRALRARLGRDPSAAELNAERRAFDARIVQINRTLVARRAEIAGAVQRDRAFPRALEASLLGLKSPDPQLRSPEAREGMRALLQSLLLR
jgi:hypothetical protein